MKKFQVLTVLSLTCFIFACSENNPNLKVGETSKSLTVDTELSQSDMVKRGEYLTTIMGCNDCHSPKIMTAQGPVPDPARLLSGHPSSEPLPKIDKKASQGWVLFNMNNTAAVGPWGVSFAGNLTPDESGIGNWTLDNFKKALKEGKFKGLDGSRMLLPPMPWTSYVNIKDEDISALFSYLKSIKPVKNFVPAPIAPDKI